MSDQTVLLPKWTLYGTIILAKGQFDHSYIYWIMPIMIFSRVQFFLVHPLYLIWYVSPVANFGTHPLGTFLKAYKSKVWTFWESHIIWKNDPHGFDVY